MPATMPVTVTLIRHGLQDDDRDGEGAQNVHGLVAVQETFLQGLEAFHRLCDVSDGGKEAFYAEDSDRDQQHGGKIFADDVNDFAGADRQNRDDGEEEDAEDPGTELREEHVSAHFKGGGAGAGNAERRPDDEHDDIHAQMAGLFRQPVQKVVLCAEPDDSQYGHNGQPGVCQHETGQGRKPFRPALQAEKRRKDEVSRAEKYGKQGKANDNKVTFAGFLHVHRRPPYWQNSPADQGQPVLLV